MRPGGMMNTNPGTNVADNRSKINAGITARFIQIGAGLVILLALLFLPSGNLYWPWAWICIGIYLTSLLFNGFFLLRLNPGMVAERGRPKEMRNWDKLISALWSLSQFILIPLMAGLDYRWGWSGSLDWTWHIGGGVLFALGLALFGWGMITNSFFSTVVRIQTDRGHMVCDQGPYRFVRHPGYLGTILQSLGMPLLLGSYWTLLPGFMAILFIIIRTAKEDRVLHSDLPGYTDYARHVRFRILPGIW
jgi:protein-S-isoprenylcysteine O-methyltransferase Ste14